MTAEARLFSALLLFALVTVESGGDFLLKIHRGKLPKLSPDSKQFPLLRAGHAHAGVLCILAILGQLLLDAAALASPLKLAARVLFFAAPLLVSGGFFGGALKPAPDGRPGPLVMVAYAGLAVLAAAMIGTGIGLLRA